MRNDVTHDQTTREDEETERRTTGLDRIPVPACPGWQNPPRESRGQVLDLAHSVPGRCTLVGEFMSWVLPMMCYLYGMLQGKLQTALFVRSVFPYEVSSGFSALS